MGSSSPNRGENKKYLSCHHPVQVICLGLPEDFGKTKNFLKSDDVKATRRDFEDSKGVL